MTEAKKREELRVPPHSEEAERGVIGSAMLEYATVVPVAIGKFALTAESFYLPAHRIIWGAIEALQKKDRPIDVLTVTDELRVGNDLEKAGGVSTIMRMIDATPTAAHAEYYCDIVRRKAGLRKLIGECRRLEHEAYETEDADVLVCGAPDRMMSIIHTPENDKSNEQLMSESLQKWRDATDGKKPAIGLETPWKAATFMTCGLEVGVTILAGRPSAGKTTLEAQLSDYIAGRGTPVYRVTLDSTRGELLERSICREAEISLPRMKFGYGFHKQHTDATTAAMDIAKLPMFIDDGVRDINQIMSRTRAMKAKHGIGLLTVDYIQLVRAPDMGRTEWDTVTRVTHVSAMLKDLSFSLGIPVLVLCQLSRAVEKEGREPQLSDLRDSGAIEQDASKVIFLYVDPEKKKEMDTRSPGATKHKRPVICNLMKHKNGETGVLPMWLYPPYFRFHPAKSDPVQNRAFIDDDLPLTMKTTEQELRERPQYMPKEEQGTFAGREDADDGHN
jgi:replicative DNA helicase